MKIGLILLLFLSLVSCSEIEVVNEDAKVEVEKSISTVEEPTEALEPTTQTIVIEPDSLFKLESVVDEDVFLIIPPKRNNFDFSDSSVKLAPYKIEDFNGDNKRDLIFDFGACGTGGCVYGIFINQYDEYYRLAFMDYLKGPQFEKEKDGTWSLSSYEEVEAYDPSKLHVAVFKFEKETYYYELDTTYIFYDTIME